MGLTQADALIIVKFDRLEVGIVQTGSLIKTYGRGTAVRIGLTARRDVTASIISLSPESPTASNVTQVTMNRATIVSSVSASSVP